MAKNILVISCDIAETRVALIENGIIAELHIERRGAQPRGGTTGDIYLGRSPGSCPGCRPRSSTSGWSGPRSSTSRTSIRPDDFEAYLAGGRKHALGTGEGAQGAAPDEGGAIEAAVVEVEEAAAEAIAQETAEEAVAEEIEREAAADPAAEKSMNGVDETLEATGGAEAAAASAEREPDDETRDDDAGDTVEAPVELSTATGLEDPDSDPPPPPAPEDLDDLLDNPNLPGFTVSDPGAPMPRAPAPKLDERRDGRSGDKWRRGRGRGRGGRTQQGRSGGGGGGGGGGDDHGGRDHRPRTSGSSGRLSKSTPIRDVVKEGQEIIVQITKEPIGTKGARCSSHISLPGPLRRLPADARARGHQQANRQRQGARAPPRDDREHEAARPAGSSCAPSPRG